jgi:putative tricarboxylic transport membrane protein
MLQTPLLTKTQHSYKDLKPVANIFFDPMVLYVHTDSPFKTLKDILDDAKKNPGKHKWGAATPGSVEHMLIHQMRSKAGINVNAITYEGGGDALKEVLGKTIDAAIGEPQELTGQTEAKQIRILASFTDQKLPGVSYPTAKEQGLNIVVTKFRGLLGPKDMPAEAVRTLENAVQKALQTPEYKKYIASVQLIPAYMGSQEYQRYLDKMDRDLTAYLQEIGVKRKET